MCDTISKRAPLAGGATPNSHTTSGPATSRPSPARSNAGHSLLEALMVLAIIGILSGGASGMHQWLQGARLKTAASQLFADLQLTRSEAIKRRLRVNLCQSPDGKQCGNSRHWEQGWLVFVDRNRNNQIDEGEQVVRVQAALGHALRLRWRGSGFNQSTVSFLPHGGFNKNGRFILCHPNQAQARQIVVFRSGRARMARSPAQQPNSPCHTA